MDPSRRSTRKRKPAVITNFFDPDDAFDDEDLPRPKPGRKSKRPVVEVDDDDDPPFEPEPIHPTEHDGPPDGATDADDYEEEPPPESPGVESASDAASIVSGGGGGGGEGGGGAPRNAFPGRDRRTQAFPDPGAIEPYPFSKKTTRAYEGPLKRQRKTPYILEYMYGPEDAHTQIACGMLNRWYAFDVRPGRAVDDETGPMATPWVREGFEAAQAAWWRRWMGGYRAGSSALPQHQRTTTVVSAADLGDHPPPGPGGDLAVLLGPYGDQDEVVFGAGEARGIALDDHDLPIGDEDDNDDGASTPAGWILDVGGLVPSLAWAPRSASGPQYLALCLVPHSDQEHPNTAERDAHRGSRRRGTIQLWRFPGRVTEFGEMVPSADAPVLVRTLCFDWGRARRVRWCPVQPTDDSVLGLLGVLTGDGLVRVLEVPMPEDAESQTCVKIEESMFTLFIDNEQGVEATAFAWANTNRVVVGYTDGSIALWSLHPQLLLSRHPLHPTYVLDLATGYPSRPYLVTSVPIFGLPTLVDLACPGYETTALVRNSITTQPHLLQWSDHLQGFLSCYPSGSVAETSVSFMHHRYFPHVRRAVDVPGQLNCLAAGHSHPFLLVGLKDGSVWACNAAKKLFAMRTDKPMRQRVFEHEYRPAERFADGPGGGGAGSGGVRGAVRILAGWGPEQNAIGAEAAPKRRRKGGKGGRGGGAKKGKKGALGGDDDAMDVEGEEAVVEEDVEEAKGTGALVNHEPLTRIMSMEWNPNLECGCWAAVAAASGIVRVMDLGVAPKPGKP